MSIVRLLHEHQYILYEHWTDLYHPVCIRTPVIVFALSVGSNPSIVETTEATVFTPPGVH